jgi:hypothetical protein
LKKEKRKKRKEKEREREKENPGSKCNYLTLGLSSRKCFFLFFWANFSLQNTTVSEASIARSLARGRNSELLCLRSEREREKLSRLGITSHLSFFFPLSLSRSRLPDLLQ